MSFQKRIGILGGGQLAQMLALKAHELGLQPHVLSQYSTDPAAQCTQFHRKGDFNKILDVKKFLNFVDFVTFESEFINTEILDFLETHFPKTYPNPKLMMKLQDRLTQKQLLEKFQVPTSSFENLDQAQLLAHRSFPQVLKARKNGYDGNGTFVLKKFDLKKSNQIQKKFPAFITEDFVPFQRELAISTARSSNGSLAILPFAETIQKDNRCLYVTGPILETQQLKKIKSKLISFVKNIDYVGLISFELFDTGSKIFVNEIAPRVHNSAHYSLDALSCDQFSLHLMCGLGAELSSPTLYSQGFAMFNLLGSSDKVPTLSHSSQVKLHWYGKNENRAGRKMGHLTALANTSKLAKLKLLKFQRKIKL